MFHCFRHISPSVSLPERFTYPFCYTPHPLSVMAATEVQDYLKLRTEWLDELSCGKMFGVLVVKSPNGELGFLAAFSGLLAGECMHSYFVPPIVDILQPDGFFKAEEKEISAINERLQLMGNSSEYQELKLKRNILTLEMSQKLAEWKELMKRAKEERDRIRSSVCLSLKEQERLVRESQYQKAEYKRLEKYYKEQLETVGREMEAYEEQMFRYKDERKRRSAALQHRLFEQFYVLNARGETRNLCDIFAGTPQKVPPSGAGECAAPKLLQYAYKHGFEPLAMAEFWWGNSPKSEIRIHGYYYPSCKNKCEPILGYMLQGLDVEPNPLLQEHPIGASLETVFEDEYLLVVNKPSGILSVPGKDGLPSVYQYIKEKYPQATGPLMVHRLDMDTSGLLLIAKNKEVHAMLQKQFEDRKVKKRYVAILDGTLSPELPGRGFIRLPLSPDYVHRPCQKVDETYGKPSVTRYEVVGMEQWMVQGECRTVTRVHYYPLTGRTHQLRVHSAHAQGMSTPIVGDRLYGRSADRLYLHADMLEFRHPITHGRIVVEAKVW